MATARDTLLTDMLKLFKTAYSERSELGIGTLLEKFRIQAKSGPDSTRGTARELLSVELLKLWKTPPLGDLSQAILGAVNLYRMQVKQTGDKKTATKDKAKGLTKKLLNKLPLQPLAGGPQKRQRVRGECPKCHSMGVVLARSYNGDEYFSCIYCGYQTYRASMDLEFDLPLAAELLNRRFDEKDQPRR
ncbi:MAG: hypothetical protein WCK42_03930 [Myxococcaceae bacterium]